MCIKKKGWEISPKTITARDNGAAVGVKNLNFIHCWSLPHVRNFQSGFREKCELMSDRVILFASMAQIAARYAVFPKRSLEFVVRLVIH